MFETGANSWNGTRMRHGDIEGTVFSDENGVGIYRYLRVKMDNNTVETITMTNVGPDPKELCEWEWQHVGSSGLPSGWYRF